MMAKSVWYGRSGWRPALLVTTSWMVIWEEGNIGYDVVNNSKDNNVCMGDLKGAFLWEDMWF